MEGQGCLNRVEGSGCLSRRRACCTLDSRADDSSAGAHAAAVSGMQRMQRRARGSERTEVVGTARGGPRHRQHAVEQAVRRQQERLLCYCAGCDPSLSILGRLTRGASRRTRGMSPAWPPRFRPACMERRGKRANEQTAAARGAAVRAAQGRAVARRQRSARRGRQQVTPRL